MTTSSNIPGASPNDHGLFTNDTSVLTFNDQFRDDMPSEKYGLTLSAPLFVGFIFVSIVMTALIMRCSRQQEYRSSAKKREKQKQREMQIKAALSTRSSLMTTDDTASIETMVDETASSYPSSVGEKPSPREDEPNDGLLLCLLCSQPLELSCPIYESNNPECRHRFHASCMDQWLEIQNTCPLCNEPYVMLA